jgi:hypothetical protein
MMGREWKGRHTPPPLELKPGPNVLLEPWTPHPAFPSVPLKQLLVRLFPSSLRLTLMLQPSVVCNVIWFP